VKDQTMVSGIGPSAHLGCTSGEGWLGLSVEEKGENKTFDMATFHTVTVWHSQISGK